MPPILDPEIIKRQRLGRIIGRIRIGARVDYVTKDGETKQRPVTLGTFRLTSGREDVIRAAAAWLGGEVRPWNNQFETYTEAKQFPVVVPPEGAVDQWMELWGTENKEDGVVCLRRCTGGEGAINQIDGKECLCPADDRERRRLAKMSPPRACRPTTRLYVLLPNLPDAGRFALRSQGENAAVEIFGSEKLLYAAARGKYVVARLRVEQRQTGRHHYAVPVLEVPEDVTLEQIAAQSAETLGAILPEVTAATFEIPPHLALPGREHTAAAIGGVVTDRRTASDFAALAEAATTRGELIGIGNQAREAGVMDSFLPPGGPDAATLKEMLIRRLGEIGSTTERSLPA